MLDGQLRMESITGLWDDDTDIREWSGVDFQTRRKAVAIYDPDHTYRSALHSASETDGVGLTHAALFDYALRVYTAWLFDTYHSDARARFDQHRLIPPKGWLDANRSRLPRVEYTVERVDHDEPNAKMFNPSTAPHVFTMVEWVVAEQSVGETISDYAKAAITFLVDGYERSETLLHERDG